MMLLEDLSNWNLVVVASNELARSLNILDVFLL